MRFNEKDMGVISRRTCELEGRLQHRPPNGGGFRETGFRERYFKLVGNLLFYFRISDLGKIEEEPMGVMVLENSTVCKDKESVSFGFEIIFNDEADKKQKHVFTARTDLDVERWIAVLQNASFQYWTDTCNELKSEIKKKQMEIETANNPLHPDFKEVRHKSEFESSTDEDLIKF